MATRKVISQNPQKNAGGTILYGGDIGSQSTNVTNAPGSEITGHRSGKYGASVPAPTATSSTFKPFTSGSFAFVMKEGKYVIMGYTQELSGQANTIMNSPGADYNRRSIHKVEHMRRLDENAWDYVTGAVTKGVNAGAKADYYSQRDEAATTPNDDAANPTREVPGELTIMEGGILPVNKDYEEKTGG